MIRKINNWIDKQAHLLFLLALVSSVLLIVFIDSELRDFADKFLSSVIIISAIYLLIANQVKLMFVRFMGIIALSGIWLDFLLENMKLLNGFVFIVSLLFYTLILSYLFKTIFNSKQVNQNVLYASISGYILLGLIGALFCRLVNLFYENAYTSTVISELQIADYVYYSFVTLTTLGYGDIVPTNVQSKALAIFLALIGQLYLTILIAIIVGKFLRDAPNDDERVV